MNALSTVDAILLSNEFKSFDKKKDGQVETIEYYEAKFLISDENEKSEVLTLRGKDMKIEIEPNWEAVVAGKTVGKLTFRWEKNDYDKTFKPKFEDFKLS